MQKCVCFFYSTSLVVLFFIQSIQGADWKDEAINKALWAGGTVLIAAASQIIYHEFVKLRDKEEHDRTYTLKVEAQQKEERRLLLWEKQLFIDSEKTVQIKRKTNLSLYKQARDDYNEFCNSKNPHAQELCEIAKSALKKVGVQLTLLSEIS